MTAAELDQLLRSQSIGAAPAPADPLVSQREQFAALERHRHAQRMQWVIGGVLAAAGVYWLHNRVWRLEQACAAMHEVQREETP